MGPCSHPRAPGFLAPGRLGGPGSREPLIAWGPPGDLGAPSRAGGPLLGEILGTCLVSFLLFLIQNGKMKAAVFLLKRFFKENLV